jgi:hypothetical protein
MTENRVKLWIDDYLSGKITSTIFSVLIVLDSISKNELFEFVSETIPIAMEMCLTSKKHLSPKDEQDIKNKLAELIRIYNLQDYDGKEEDIAKVNEAIQDIIELLR